MLPDYKLIRILNTNKELLIPGQLVGQFAIRELRIGNILFMQDNDTDIYYSLVRVTAIKEESVEFTPLVSDYQTFDLTENEITQHIYGVLINQELLFKLNFSEEIDSLSPDSVFFSDYDLCPGKAHIRMTKFKYYDEWSVHIDNCDCDTIGNNHNIQELHQLQNFIIDCGYNLDELL